MLHVRIAHVQDEGQASLNVKLTIECQGCGIGDPGFMRLIKIEAPLCPIVKA